jgi:hypothetical protein
LICIENRLAALIPPPVRKLPILIGGTGPSGRCPLLRGTPTSGTRSRTSTPSAGPATASMSWQQRSAGNDADIERSTLWENADSADAFRDAGVTLFQAELTPTTVTTSRRSSR